MYYYTIVYDPKVDESCVKPFIINIKIVETLNIHFINHSQMSYGQNKSVKMSLMLFHLLLKTIFSFSL